MILLVMACSSFIANSMIGEFKKIKFSTVFGEAGKVLKCVHKVSLSWAFEFAFKVLVGNVTILL